MGTHTRHPDVQTTGRDRVQKEFRARFGAAPELVARAPGRVNLIGEHTDYNDGFVLPMAIDRAVWIALRPRADRVVSLTSLDFGEERQFSLDEPRGEGSGWIEYVRGMAWALGESGRPLSGWEGVLASDVPVGAGLSSSAALELAVARVFSAVSGFPWVPRDMARLAQRAENQWVGVNCGVMDQMIAASGQTGHALLIDCRSLEAAPVPLPPGVAVVVLDTATRRGLVDSEYNQRRGRCEAAAMHLGVRALRDVELIALDTSVGMDPVTYRRARHVITENQRTLDAVAAMRRGDAAELGRLMTLSHASLRDDFQVSRPELDVMVELARALPACYGARMTGAGFGGCAVALMERQAAEEAARLVVSRYNQRVGVEATFHLCAASAGASVVAP